MRFMRKFFKAIGKLWRFATCDHMNRTVALAFPDSTEICICQRCGRVLFVMDDGDRRHNPEKKRDQLERSA